MVHAAIIPPNDHLRGNHFLGGGGSDRFSKVRFLDLEGFLGGFVMNDIGLPARLYRAGFPQKAVLAGTAGQVFSLQSWSSFWLHRLHYSADRP